MMSMSTIQLMAIWLVAMHAGHVEEQSGSSLAVLALGVVVLVIAATLVLRRRRSGRGAS